MDLELYISLIKPGLHHIMSVYRYSVYLCLDYNFFFHIIILFQ